MWKQRPSVVIPSMLSAVLLSGCGIGEIADDAVDVVKVIAENPKGDAELVKDAGGIAATIAVRAAWALVHDGVSESVVGPDGTLYYVRANDLDGDALAIWRVDRDGVETPVVVDPAITAIAIVDGRLRWTTCEVGP